MTPDAAQACVACGESTAPGRALFVGRRVVPHDEGNSYLCAVCDEQVAARRRGKKLTDDQLRRLVENGAMGVYVWSGFCQRRRRRSVSPRLMAGPPPPLRDDRLTLEQLGRMAREFDQLSSEDGRRWQATDFVRWLRDEYRAGAGLGPAPAEVDEAA
jgi:hypothetical protein